MSDERPWLHADATPPQEWLRLEAAELLETKVSAEWLAAEWQSAADDCSVPLVKNTGELRARLQKYPTAFHSTMLRLGGRIADALKDNINFEWDDFCQSLCERVEVELGRRWTPPSPEPEPEPDDEAAAAAAESESMDASAVKQEPDAVFARHTDAQAATLIAKGKADLIRLAQSGKKGDDGSLVANGWRPAVAGADEVRGYAKDAAPRGKHAAKKARHGEGALDDEFDPAYDDPVDDDPVDNDADAAALPTAAKGKRALGPQARLEQMLDKGLVFWCAFCNDKKPVQSLKAMVSHRGGGKQSCWRGSGKRNATIDAQRADGFLFFSEPPPPLPQQSTGSRGGRGAVGRGGRSGCRAGPGRGRKGKEAKAAEMAAKAAYLAAKYPGQSKMAEQAAASSSAGPSSSADDVEVLGEMTWAERDAELRSSAVDCDSD
jgi:hypothetical protein